MTAYLKKKVVYVEGGYNGNPNWISNCYPFYTIFKYYKQEDVEIKDVKGTNKKVILYKEYNDYDTRRKT